MGLFKPFIGNVFGLSDIYDLQVDNIENKNFASWPESAKYGYTAGGGPPFVGTVTRLDFSNTTVSLPAKNLPTVRYQVAGVTNSN